MTDRIDRLAAESRKHDLLAPPVEVEYDPMDHTLPEAVYNAKRITEYILAQPVYLTEDNRFTGMLRMDLAHVPCDVFTRRYHDKSMGVAFRHFYLQYRENLVTFEWQHSAPDYPQILSGGIVGRKEAVRISREKHGADPDKAAFLDAMDIVLDGVIGWADKCADAHEAAAKECADPIRRAQLFRIADACRHSPRYPARTFFEALQTVLICFQYLPDSVGTLDRYLRPYLEADLGAGLLTRDEAKELVAEAFVYISNFTVAGTANADRSAECHFAVGGLLPDGTDGFSDTSRLLVEALTETDVIRPAISLRWNEKTPFEVLYYMLDVERHDKYKRFAFVSDTPRIAGLQKICGMSFEEACRYTMVGCNEPSFPGTTWFGGETANIVRSLTNTLYGRKEEILACRTFEEFYAIWQEELSKDIDRMLWYSDRFNYLRSKDENVLSCFMLDGCIESATSVTRGGCSTKIAGLNIMGLTALIDSLTVIRHFVFDTGRTDMTHLLDVLEHNWENDEDLRTEILRTAPFFGNNHPLSNGMAQRVSRELYALTRDRRNLFGAPFLIGTLAGYHPHHVAFGKTTRATPDGRRDGDPFMVGCGQAEGKDREGLLPLLSSLAVMDPEHILTGPVVCNVLVEETVIRDDEQFMKFCRTVERYFRMGGIHIQLNYVSKDELREALECPEKYQTLRVRVSGFSATYVLLDERLQQDILRRTEEKG